jgi:mitochondrial import inner membrane translocase subunit TIM50
LRNRLLITAIGILNPPDVREVLKSMHGKDIPLEFAKKEAEAKQKFLEEWQSSRGASSNSYASGLISRFTGKPNEGPRTYLEEKRAKAQQTYLEEQAYYNANRENFDKSVIIYIPDCRLIEEDRKQQMEAMKGTLWGWMSGSGNQPGSKPEDQKGVEGIMPKA